MMTREELLRIEGRTPRPWDFDAFWDEALEELKSSELKLRLEPAFTPISGVSCFHMTFTGMGGTEIYAKYLKGQDKKKVRPVLLVFHGYRRSSPSWSNLLQYVCAGFDVMAMDCRGQGGKSQDPGGAAGTTFNGHLIRGLDDPDPHQMLMHKIMLDTVVLAKIALGPDKKTPVAAYGASQGGGLALACAALVPEIKRVVAVCPFLCDYQGVWEMQLEDSAYVEIREYFRMFDPKHEREKDIFTRLGYIDVLHLAPRIRGEVLMMTGGLDTACPPASQYAAFNRITAPKKDIYYPDFPHEVCPDMEDEGMKFLLPLTKGGN